VNHVAHRVVLISISLAFSWTPFYTARLWTVGYEASALQFACCQSFLCYSFHL